MRLDRASIGTPIPATTAYSGYPPIEPCYPVVVDDVPFGGDEAALFGLLCFLLDI